MVNLIATTALFLLGSVCCSAGPIINIFSGQEERGNCLIVCIIGGIFSQGITDKCSTCLHSKDRSFLGESQVPFGFLADIMQMKLGMGYTEMWCGNENLPGGWAETSKGSNTWTGCEITEQYPGDFSTSHQSHAYVKAEMATVPGLQNSGEVWRGSELGFMINNELYASDMVSPRAIALGCNVNQHKVVRPFLTETYGTCDSDCQDELRESVRELFQKKSINVQDDIKILVHHRLFERTFPGADNPIDTADFIDTQLWFVLLSSVTQALPDYLSNILEIFTRTRKKLECYFNQLLPLVQDYYGEELENEDCSPTVAKDGFTACEMQLTAVFLDALLAAGGLSVPGAISTGLWILYGDTAGANDKPDSKDKFPVDYELQHGLKGKDSELAFYYESMRIFPPVVGFPWWTTPPERAFDDFASQTEGGVRKILNLALANQDPNVWGGGDAYKFDPKPLSEYHENFVGFADFALNDTVADGKMNRKCPGKDLALQFGKIFFEEFDQDRWCTADNVKYTKTVPFFDDFTLRSDLKPEGASCTKKILPWRWRESECCSGRCKFSHMSGFRLEYKCA